MIGEFLDLREEFKWAIYNFTLRNFRKAKFLLGENSASKFHAANLQPVKFAAAKLPATVLSVVPYNNYMLTTSN